MKMRRAAMTVSVAVKPHDTRKISLVRYLFNAVSSDLQSEVVRLSSLITR